MSSSPDVLFSSGSACSGHEATASHVLTSLGLGDAEARRSGEFGIGRFNTQSEIESAAEYLVENYLKLLRIQS